MTINQKLTFTALIKQNGAIDAAYTGLMIGKLLEKKKLTDK